MKRLKLVADENIPLVTELFSPFADILSLPGREIRREHLLLADVLLCRSVLPVDQNLLRGTSVKFIGTATIGIDHLDIGWLDEQSICYRNAAGCNAAAVAQYVLSSIAFWCLKQANQLADIKVGIIGAGNVGSELAGCLEYLGIPYLLCDPPLERAGDNRRLVNLQAIAECDVISLHVPLTYGGVDRTFHLVNQHFLAHLNPTQLLVNAARGAVIDNLALESYLQSPNAASVVLDVFENEPDVPGKLIEQCLLATPHIAGHTLEGKLRGSWMIFQAFCEHFGLTHEVDEKTIYPPPTRWQPASHSLAKQLLQMYPIDVDSDKLKMRELSSDIATHFDKIRKNYLDKNKDFCRRDYSFWQAAEVSVELANLCKH